MRESSHDDNGGWQASVFYTECFIACTLEIAWERMLDYEAWNPSFAHSQVSRVRGEPRSEGELVLIKKSILRANGEPYPEFYAETVKVVPHRHIVWYIYPKEGDAFRNFVDLALKEESSGVRFTNYYYAQNRLSGGALAEERKLLEQALHKNALALKSHCEINT